MRDLWLLKTRAGDPGLAALRGAVAGLAAWHAVEDDEVYAFAPAGTPERALALGAPQSAWIRLTATIERPGASAQVDAPFHYIVETDVLPDREDEFNAWYDQEHLPGLASVPGTVRAARYMHAGGSPRYYACYDLVTPGTLGSPPWLAVRGTAWSSRVRPAFLGTKRTMFRR